MLTGRELRSMADSTELNRSPWRQETVITATHASPTAPNDAAAVGQNDQRLTGSDPREAHRVLSVDLLIGRSHPGVVKVSFLG